MTKNSGSSKKRVVTTVRPATKKTSTGKVVKRDSKIGKYSMEIPPKPKSKPTSKKK